MNDLVIVNRITDYIPHYISFREEIRNEIKALKKDYKNDKKSSEKPATSNEIKEIEHNNDMVESYLSEQRKYKHNAKDLPKKGDARFEFTIKFHFFQQLKHSNIFLERGTHWNC